MNLQQSLMTLASSSRHKPGRTESDCSFAAAQQHRKSWPHAVAVRNQSHSHLSVKLQIKQKVQVHATTLPLLRQPLLHLFNQHWPADDGFWAGLIVFAQPPTPILAAE